MSYHYRYSVILFLDLASPCCVKMWPLSVYALDVRVHFQHFILISRNKTHILRQLLPNLTKRNEYHHNSQRLRLIRILGQFPKCSKSSLRVGTPNIKCYPSRPFRYRMMISRPPCYRHKHQDYYVSWE